MKKILIITILLASAVVYGQFNTGSVYFSGLTAFNTGVEINQGYGNILLGFHPEGGYFLKNRLGIGAGIFTDVAIPVGELASSTPAQYEIYFGPNVRYYIPRGDDWQIYLYGYGFYGFLQEFESHQLFGVQVGPGVNYFLTERIAFDARFTYTLRHEWNTEFGGSHQVHRIFFEMGISVFFPSIKFFVRD